MGCAAGIRLRVAPPATGKCAQPGKQPHRARGIACTLSYAPMNAIARQRLTRAGLILNYLYIPWVEDFIARKGKRHTLESRPCRSRDPVARKAGAQTLSR